MECLTASQAIYGQTYAHERDLHKNLQKRLEFLNHDFPSSALGGKSPFQAFPQAKHSGRTYQVDAEEALMDINRIYTYRAKGKWFRVASSQGQFSLGKQRYNVGMPYKNTTLEITFDLQTLRLLALTEDAPRTFQFAPTQLTKQDLIGDLALRNALPPHQLPLPFSPETIRQTLMDRPIPGMIL